MSGQSGSTALVLFSLSSFIIQPEVVHSSHFPYMVFVKVQNPAYGYERIPLIYEIDRLMLQSFRT